MKNKRVNLALSTSILALMCCLASLAASAQFPEPLPQPDLQLLRAGMVAAIARQPDGGLIIGGSFTSIAGVPRSNIARLLPDGTLDPDWNPSADGAVTALATDASGTVYAGGGFTSIGGLPRNRIAKLSGYGAGSVDATWNPSADNDIRALAIDSNGAILAAGHFTNIGGQSRICLAKLSATGNGAADLDWNPSPDDWVETLVAGSDGSVYVGGRFSTIGGQQRSRIAKLNGNGIGAADSSWNPNASSNVGGGSVEALAIDPDGAVYAAGIFASIGGASRLYLAKLSGSGTGAADMNWNPSPDGVPQALTVDASGGIYVGGVFTFIGGQPRSNVARLSTSGNGEADPNWNHLVNGGVQALSVSANSTVHVGGPFSVIDGISRIGIAEVSGSGNIGAATDAMSPGYVSATVVQPNGGLIVAGGFREANGQARGGLLRLNPDWTLDPDWTPSVNGWVNALAVDPMGAVYAGGRFTSIGGQAHAKLAKLAADGNGAADPVWNPAPDGEVSSIAVDASGSAFVGGSFHNIGGQSRNYLAKLATSGSGSADPAWDPSPNSKVLALALDANGALRAGGNFSQIGGEQRSYIAQLSTSGSGTADPIWNPSANGAIASLVIDQSGVVYASGYFSEAGGQLRSGIAKLSGGGAGAADPAWNPAADGVVYSLALDSAGSVYAGGDFTSIGGQLRNYLARLSGTGVGNADPGWNPSANGPVWTLSIANGGTALAGGDFTSMGGMPRNGLAALPASIVVFRDGFDSTGVHAIHD